MTSNERVRPRAATCEDYDEDTKTTLPGSRTSAKVPAKDLVLRGADGKGRQNGADSGYASRADTVVSEELSRNTKEKLKVDTGVPERGRQPYSMAQVPTPSTPPRPENSHLKETKSETRPAARRQTYTHERGTCFICDQYGKHFDIKDEMSRPSSAAPPQPSSPTVSRQPATKSAKDDESLRPKTRRQSSGRKPRPLNVIPPMPGPVYAQQAVYSTPIMAPPGWATTPITPTVSYTTVPYSYPVNPLPTPTYPTYSQQPGPYFDPNGTINADPRPAKPSRRLSGYGEPIVQNGYGKPPSESREKATIREKRSSLVTEKSSRNFDADRERMPPPPKPQQSEIVIPRRPSINSRSQTFHTQESLPRVRPSRDSMQYAVEDEDEDEGDDKYPESRPPLTPRGRRESSNLPPSSYRGPTNGDGRDRPTLQRKSVSMYTTPTATTHVASSKSAAMVRRTTVPAMSIEEKLANAENHQRSRGSVTKDLTAENLRDLTHRTTSSRSESGSNYSHKSRQSSSKDSSGRDRSHTSGHASSATTSIHIPGGVKVSLPADYNSRDGRPLSINLGNNIVISMGKQDLEPERYKEQKRIERAPSVTSRHSRKSEASSAVSSRDKDRDRELQPSSRSSRRPSHVEERQPSSRSSRAPSVSRRSVDFSLQEYAYGA